MKLRELSVVDSWYRRNDGTRTLFESIISPEVLEALKDWKREASDAVLIGGLALSYYVKPRYTQDVDFLFASDKAIPLAIDGFKRTRPGAFQHKRTHVEIEVVHPTSINTSQALVDKAFETAIEEDGVKIASPSGLVALKLGRYKAQDKADIIALIKTGKVDLKSWPLDEKLKKNFEDAEQAADQE